MTRARRLIDRYPFNSPWVRGWIAKWFWPIWFVLIGTVHVLNLFVAPGSFGLDVRVYHLAAQAWLGGGDPWAVAILTGLETPAIRFAGPPPTLIPFALVGWVPVDVVVLVFVLGQTAIALWILRRLNLPAYWLLFPPVIEAIWVGNMNITVIALLLLGGVVASTVATLLKVYALVPLVIRGRLAAAACAVVVTVVTLPILPWGQFLSDFAAISATLAEQSWGGRSSFLTGPIPWILGAVALVMLGRERAAWLAVPLLWPSTQLHYSVLAMPVFATVPVLAIAGSITEPGVLRAAVIAFAFWERRSDLKRAINQVRRRVARSSDSVRTIAVDAQATGTDGQDSAGFRESGGDSDVARNAR